MRYSLKREAEAKRIEGAVQQVLSAGLRTADIAGPTDQAIGTRAMGAALLEALGPR
jgi:3-isopropylmalate dehydrogenase